MRLSLLLCGLALLGGTAQASCPSAEQARTLTRVFEERLSQGRVEGDAELFMPDFFINMGAGRKATLQQDQQAVQGWKAAFPDLEAKVLDMVCAGDRAAVRWQVRGTNTGSGNGLPATGKPVDVQGFSLYRMEGARIAESWGSFDRFALFQQLGMLQLQGLGGGR